MKSHNTFPVGGFRLYYHPPARPESVRRPRHKLSGDRKPLPFTHQSLYKPHPSHTCERLTLGVPLHCPILNATAMNCPGVMVTSQLSSDSSPLASGGWAQHICLCLPSQLMEHSACMDILLLTPVRFSFSFSFSMLIHTFISRGKSFVIPA